MSATVPFTEALVYDHNPDLAGAPNYFNISKVQNFSSPSATTMSHSGTWGSVSGFASSNLSTGQLKASGSASYTGSGDSVYQTVNAFFGDGFRTYDQNGPFQWQGNSTARFSLTVDGSYTSNPSVDILGEGAFVLLNLYQPGTLPSPDGNISGSPGLIGYYLYLIGNPNQNLFSCSTTGNCTQLLSSRYVGTLSQSAPVTIVQDFQPGSDFDWVLLLGISGSLYNPGSWNFNLADTLTFNYEGPQGTTTQSESGEFNNYTIPTTTVPEPGSLLLVASGLAGVLRIRRARG